MAKCKLCGTEKYFCDIHGDECVPCKDKRITDLKAEVAQMSIGKFYADELHESQKQIIADLTAQVERLAKWVVDGKFGGELSVDEVINKAKDGE